MVTVIHWCYDEEDYPGVTTKIIDAVHELSEGGTKPVDARAVPVELCPDVYAVIVADYPLTDEALAEAWGNTYDDF